MAAAAPTRPTSADDDARGSGASSGWPPATTVLGVVGLVGAVVAGGWLLSAYATVRGELAASRRTVAQMQDDHRILIDQVTGLTAVLASRIKQIDNIAARVTQLSDQRGVLGWFSRGSATPAAASS
jgi:hypothetical protein